MWCSNHKQLMSSFNVLMSFKFHSMIRQSAGLCILHIVYGIVHCNGFKITWRSAST